LSEFATKEDLRHEISNLRKDMDIKLEKTESVLRQEMSEMKFKLVKWLVGLRHSVGWPSDRPAEVFAVRS